MKPKRSETPILDALFDRDPVKSDTPILDALFGSLRDSKRYDPLERSKRVDEKSRRERQSLYEEYGDDLAEYGDDFWL